jgi:hypothetical protein
MKKIYFLTMMVIIVTMFLSNYAEAENVPTVHSVEGVSSAGDAESSIDLISTLTLQVNESMALDPVVSPASEESPLTWHSNNEIVATVSQSGVVKAQSVGTAVVSVRTAEGEKAFCTVTVTSSAPDPIGLSWTGSYNVTSSVDRGHVSDYDYPNEFTMTIYEHDGAFYAAGMVGMSLDSTIYDGLKVNVLDEQHAEIDLSYCYDLGYRTWTGCFLSCMYIISPQSKFQPEELEEGKIAIARESDGTLVIDDFYIFAFGLSTDYEVVLDAAYHSVRCKNMSSSSHSSSVPSIIAEEDTTDSNEIYNLNGVLVYSGDENGKPELAPGIYVFRRGSNVQKVMVR